MNPRFRYLLPVTALLGIVIWSLAQPLFAQDPPADPADGDQAEETVREQSIYIPYEKLRQVFEKHGRGVFLPYEEFQRIWQESRQKTTPPAELEPPVGALITEIENEATASEDVVKVNARLKIEILAEGWNEIPLRLADAAITKATLGDQPARIVGAENQNYKLLVEKKGKQPEQIELALEYAKAITREPGKNSVSFQAPQAPVSRWRVRIPQSGVKVNIHPLIAAAEVPAGEDGAAEVPNEEQPEETVVLAFVGAAPVVRIDWTPKAEGAMGLAALASVQAEQQVWIHEGVTRIRAKLAYEISRAELSQLAIELPADHKVVNVFDPNVRQWLPETVDDRRQITVQLFEPAKGSQQVTVVLEKFAGDKPEDTLLVPVVKALGVGRQQGDVAVQVDEGLRAETTPTSGLIQVDVTDLPETLAGGDWNFSYHYAAVPAGVPLELKLAVEKIEPRIVVDSLVEAYLEPEQLSLDTLAIYSIERAGVFQLQLDVPAGYEVRRVYGPDAADTAPAEVDSHDLEGEDQTRLVVNLARKATGRVALAVELQKELQEPGLLDPDQQPAEIPLTIPQVALDTVDRAVGRLVIYAPEKLRVNPGETEGLRSVSFKKALEGMQSTSQQKTAELLRVLAFDYTHEPVALQLAAERRKPQVTIEQLLVAELEGGVVKYQATFVYKILYSGVESLRIDVPVEVAAGLRNNTQEVQEKVIDPQPDDVAEGYEAWSFTGESELLGQGKIELVWEEKIGKLDIDKSVDLELPRLRPMDVDRAGGQIVLVKAETLDIREKGEPTGLQPIDPQHDELIAEVTGAARAFKFHDDWKLTITATRYELEDVKRTSIERAVLRMVVTPADEISVQALYRMRSARQQLEIKLPDDVEFDTEPLRINGRRVPLQTQGGKYFVPLVEPGADEPFLLELRYTVPGDGSRLDPPAFPLEPAVQKVYLCAYLPEDRALLGTTGPWTAEFKWWLTPSLSWIPRPRPLDETAQPDHLTPGDSPGAKLDDEYLVSWVCGNAELATDFETDGRLYVFSTLRPAGPPDGSLRMKTRDETWLNVLVFVVAVLGGAALLPRATSDRALAIGVLVVGLVLCGVFLPTFALQILDGVLASAIFIVLVMWVVWFFVRTLPRAVAWRRAARASSPPPPPPPVTEPPPAEEPPAVEPSPEAQPKPDTDEGGKTDA